MNDGRVCDIEVAKGITLRVHEAGDPDHPTIVLCHGFPELAYSWRHQMGALADAGFHVLAPDQRGYGHSSAPREVGAYGIGSLTADLAGLLDAYGNDDAVFVGHDWGAMIVWDMARLHPHRVRAVVGASVPFVHWPAPPTRLLKAAVGEQFFYILYFQQVGPAEAELEADPRVTMATTLYGVSGAAVGARTALSEPLPIEGTGFLTALPAPGGVPFVGPEGPWLSSTDLQVYADEFAHSGFFGPLSYYRNLDANSAVTAHLSAADVTMPSCFIGGALDPVLTLDPAGIKRMEQSLPEFRGATLIPGSGHWVQQETPAAFNDALLGFLATLS